jgi:DNA-binding GntR family transcriptional regulator
MRRKEAAMDDARSAAVKASEGQAFSEGDVGLPRATLHDELTARLRALVIEGELAPGTRVPEKALCERFQVSRTPLREALKVLASEDLLELLPNRGAMVSRLTIADVEEVFPVMGALEALAGELACANITEEELAEVQALHYQMVLHYTRGELPAYFRLNQAIHEKILAAARNRAVQPLPQPVRPDPARPLPRQHVQGALGQGRRGARRHPRRARRARRRRAFGDPEGPPAQQVRDGQGSPRTGKRPGRLSADFLNGVRPQLKFRPVISTFC